jgi:hypothetical protein
VTILVSILVIAIEAFLSYWEGTLLERQWHLRMPFVKNYSVFWGGFLIFPIVNALIVPRLWVMREDYYWELLAPVAILIGYLVVLAFYCSWWGHDENRGHVFVDWTKSKHDKHNWTKDITKSGWWRFIHMPFQVAVLFLFFVLPMPFIVVILVGILLFVWVWVVNFQALIIQKSLNPKWAVCQFSIIGFFMTIKLLS